MSSNSLARLSVELAANTAAFQGDMGKAARIAEKELGSIKDAAGKMGLAIGAAAVAGGAAFLAMAKSSIDASDQMNDLSQQVGMSTEKLSAYSYAAKMNGADTEALSSGIKKLSSNMVDAARGQGAAKDAFAALGISVRGANGAMKSQDEIMREVATRFSSFEDGATKNALAVDLFGKAGGDLIPMLNQGAVGLDAMTAEAEAMGQVLSSDTAAAAGQVNDNLDQMKLMMGGAVNQVTAGMLPSFASLTEIMKRSAQDTGFMTSVANGLSVAFKSLATVVLGTQAVFQLIGDTIGKVAAAAVAAISGDFAGAKAIMADTSASDRLSDSLTNVRDLWTGVAVEAKTAATAQSGAMGAVPKYGAAKGSKAKAPKVKATNWDAAIDDTIADAGKEAGSAQQVFEREKAAAASALQSIQQSMMTKRQLLDQDAAKQRLDLQAAVQFELMSETQKKATLEQLETQHKARIKALDEEELAQKKANAAAALGFTANALSAMGSRSAAAAKAGMALSKMTALNQIRTDTPTAAMAAAKAVAGIPVIGPGLAIGAKVAMYAMGAAQAAAVMAGGSTSASGGGGFSVPSASGAAASVEPAATAREQRPEQYTTIKVESDQIYLGRQLVDLLNQVGGDGKMLSNVRFATA